MLSQVPGREASERRARSVAGRFAGPVLGRRAVALMQHVAEAARGAWRWSQGPIAGVRRPHWGPRVTDWHNEYDPTRVIGVGSIMLAHADPPETICPSRNIDITVLIAALAMTFRAIEERRPFESPSFLQHLVWRLAMPIWAFMTLWFMAVFAVAALAGKAQPFGNHHVLDPYLFLTGQGSPGSSRSTSCLPC